MTRGFIILKQESRRNLENCHVRAEVQAKRLSWTSADVERLIVPYPSHKESDEILSRYEDDTWIEEGDVPYAEDGADVSQDSEAEESVKTNEEPAVADEGETEPAVAGDPCDEFGDEASGEPELQICPADVEAVQKSPELIQTYEAAMASLKEFGAMSAVVQLENEIRKEKRLLQEHLNKYTISSQSEY